VEQRGEVPVHFATLTTAIYRWKDLAKVLAEYERCTQGYSSGVPDPLEPGEHKIPVDKLRVLKYGGVVAWFCAMKLELTVKYIMDSTDYFAVFEWGAGGIVHIHLLRWLAGKGRLDYDENGNVVTQNIKQDAVELAAGHNSIISEWDLNAPEKWHHADYDSKIPMSKSKLLDTDDESDGSSGSSDFESVDSSIGDLDEPNWRALGDFEEFVLDAANQGNYVYTDAGEAVVVELTAEEQIELQNFELALADSTWHPASIEPEWKRLIQTHTCRFVRKVRRQFLAKLNKVCNMHDRHRGQPFQIEPIYGSIDTMTEHCDAEENQPAWRENRCQFRISTWNVEGRGWFEQLSCGNLLLACMYVGCTNI
jgi:hypothetical protein